MDDDQLRTIWQQRQFDDRVALLGQPLGQLMKRQLARRVKQLSSISAIWDEIIPDSISEHTALDGFSGGTLTVIVDSSAHRFRLETLLAGGLMREIQKRFSGALNKIRLIPGQFSSIDLNGQARYEF